MLNLYILCGLPYSGKSFIAKKIEELTKAKIISYDNIRKREGLLPDTPDPNNLIEWKKIITIALFEIKSELLNGNSAIFDHVNPKKIDRKLLIDMAKEVNAKPIIVWVNTPLNIIQIRRKNNLKVLHRHHITSVNFNKILSLWQSPDTECDVYEYIPGQNIEALIENFS